MRGGIHRRRDVYCQSEPERRQRKLLIASVCVFRRFFLRGARQFVDRARVFAKAGTGGQGSKAKGSHGGEGGDVYVTASRHCTSLVGRRLQIPPHGCLFSDCASSSYTPVSPTHGVAVVIPRLVLFRLFAG